MEQKVTKRPFGQLDNIFNSRQRLINQQFSEDLALVKETIEQSFYLLDLIETRLAGEAITTGEKLSGPKALLPIIYGNNCHFLIASYKLVLQGLNNPARATLRSVFEGILQIYLLHLTKREAELFYKKDIGQLTADEEKEVKRKFNWLSPNKIREILYTEQTGKQMFKFYSVLSDSAHPSIKGRSSDIDYNENITKDNLFLILDLGFANLIAISEVYSDKMDEHEKQETDTILNKIVKRIESIPNLVPDAQTFQGKIKIKLKTINAAE